MGEVGGPSPAQVARPSAAAIGLSIGAALIAAVGVIAGAALGARLAGQEYVGEHGWLVAFLVVGLVDAIAGAALLTRLGQRRLAWCLVVGGGAAVVAVALATSTNGYDVAFADAPPWATLVETDSWARPVAMWVLVALVPWELASSGRGRLLKAAWWTTAALVAATAIGEAAGARVPGVDVVDVFTWLVAASATTATVMLLVRWWQTRGGADPLQGWLAAGAVVAWLAVVPDRVGVDGWGLPASDVLGPLLLVATIPLLVVGVLVRAMRDRPGRFQGVAHDVIGWLVLSAAIIVVYTAVVVGLGRLLGGEQTTRQTTWVLIATTCAVAISVDPARRHIRGTVDRLVWGIRDDPLEVVRNVIDHVGADPDGELLPTLATSLRRELRLDAVSIDVHRDGRWQRVATTGSPTTYERSVDLEQHGETVGRLVVGWEDGPHLRARDEHVLAELAGPLALAVGWVRVAKELRRSTIAIASTREEERRRLRRDLHDGLGPSLTGISLGLRTAIRQLERQPDAAGTDASRALLEGAAAEVDQLVLEVKRIVRDLRPTALDRHGLVDALREFTRNFGDGLEFHLDLPASDVALPAALEVAIYRIVTEAVTNIARHASAHNCWITVAVEPTIVIDVADDGCGISPTAIDGVGWTAMRERAGALGGTVQIVARRPQGTRVHVRLATP
jgi:two-component system NarL family sensor kinase